MSRTICGGKSVDNQYDPQIGQSAKQMANTSAAALDWSKQYYKDVVTPLLQQQNEAAIKAQGQMGNLYDLQAQQMAQGAERYSEYGIPAENKYYQQAAAYSTPQEYERQAQLAKGDLATAQAGQNQQMMRQMGGLGIDPTSPAALAARSDMAVRNAAAEASAMNRARNAAQQLGMALTSDAANFASGKGASNIAMFGQGAQNASSGAFGTANQALNTGMQAGSGVQQGYGQALQGYGNIMGNYTSLGNTSMNAQAQQQSALMSSLGSMAGVGAGLAIRSDMRLKENIQIIGKLPSGIAIYWFDYINGAKNQIGVMAQEVLPIIPEAVSVGDDGYYMVDYGKLR